MRKLSFFILFNLSVIALIPLFNPFMTESQAQGKSVSSVNLNDLDYGLWADVLNKHVNAQGLFDYEGLFKDRSKFDRFVQQVEKLDIIRLSKVDQKAFWINAYNAITVKVIMDAYPVKSIRNINFGLVWEKKRDVARSKFSLGHIEHKILRPMGDPRIHFAINCASIGCPKLPNKPFYPQSLDEQLDFEARRFLNDPEKIRLDRSNNILYHSAILKWFKKDFLAVAPNIVAYIKKYINAEDKVFIETNNPKVKVLKYDWSLNKQ